ncbi:DNA-binding response regulator [Niastella vici]|uniref:DNA-binding response regulator n=1 Tax=Niastella vici TaxID=1703345 RepID=A0A1V9FIY0_9BACT|nr:response regulator transcription factor [Niastella vici]OQP58319.1 DNA-binding response regulator [Niastella vici]
MELQKNSDLVTVGVVDDQQLFLRSICTLINSFSQFKVPMDALSGQEMYKKLGTCEQAPDIMLLDVNMADMDGMQTAKMLANKYPAMKLVALSTKDDDVSIIGMIRAGCCAYLVKDIHPDELEIALTEIYENGYYNNDAVNLEHRRKIALHYLEKQPKFTNRELEFLRFACSDLTYKQIAGEMCLSERTIDGYRDSLFEKMKVQSRVGMVLEALRTGLISL